MFGDVLHQHDNIARDSSDSFALMPATNGLDIQNGGSR